LTSAPGKAVAIAGTVDVVEPTGPDTMVIVDVGGKKITARLGARERPAPGGPIQLSFDPAAMVLFDPETTTRIA
jgi:multiple sugar transport system ATP-binding protein